MHPVLWQQIDKITTFRAETDTEIRTERQKRKCARCITQQEPPTTSNTITTRVKGFNFAVTPTKIPVEDIVCGVESALHNVEEHAAEIIRQEVSVVIRKAKPPKRSISKDEYAALKDLRTDGIIVGLPADKGNATVVMNRTEYQAKMEVFLQDPVYKKTVNDPTTYLVKRRN
ncbi:hypothetical protein Trydic_g16464 [Trypoxylus dichotomus]